MAVLQNHQGAVDRQWRICFEWPEGAAGPSNVEIADYH
jgi:proteic killer suppression protein